MSIWLLIRCFKTKLFICACAYLTMRVFTWGICIDCIVTISTSIWSCTYWDLWKNKASTKYKIHLYKSCVNALKILVIQNSKRERQYGKMQVILTASFYMSRLTFAHLSHLCLLCPCCFPVSSGNTCLHHTKYCYFTIQYYITF